jgi:hypothetical protein
MARKSPALARVPGIFLARFRAPGDRRRGT